MAAFSRRGLKVQPFKTGPDFIDPGYHTAITGRPSYNLDPWMHGRALTDQFLRGFTPAPAAPQLPAPMAGMPIPSPDMAIIEGGMGLFDGLPGCPTSSADVATALRVPVLLVIDSRGMAATAAAVAHGLASFRPGLPVLGAVCTFVGSPRHADLLRAAFEQHCPHIPLFGLLPQDDALVLPSRHLGLVSAREGLHPALVTALGDYAKKHLDLDTMFASAYACLSTNSPQCTVPAFSEVPRPRVRVALARDEAFSFWYPEHDSLLAAAGAEVVPFSPLRDSGLPPDCQGIILPGGYPELHAERLSANLSLRDSVRSFARQHPVYGECGGFLFLMDALEKDNLRLPMCGCLPLTARMETSRSALGYRQVVGPAPATSDAVTPWAGLVLRGHEFHYSRIVDRPDSLPPLWACHTPSAAPAGPASAMDPPVPEGAVLGHVYGSYIHLSLLSHPHAASRFVDACAHSASRAASTADSSHCAESSADLFA